MIKKNILGRVIGGTVIAAAGAVYLLTVTPLDSAQRYEDGQEVSSAEESMGGQPGSGDDRSFSEGQSGSGSSSGGGAEGNSKGSSGSGSGGGAEGGAGGNFEGGAGGSSVDGVGGSSGGSSGGGAGGSGSGGGSESGSEGKKSESEKLININTASASELETLKGIGPSRAAAIIEYREKYNGFVVKEEIMMVPGIKEGIYGKICDQITVGD